MTLVPAKLTSAAYATLRARVDVMTAQSWSGPIGWDAKRKEATNNDGSRRTFKPEDVILGQVEPAGSNPRGAELVKFTFPDKSAFGTMRPYWLKSLANV